MKSRAEQIAYAAWECFSRLCKHASEERVPDSKELYYKVNPHLSITMIAFKQGAEWADQNPDAQGMMTNGLFGNILQDKVKSLEQQLTQAHEALAIAREALEMKHDEALITQKALAKISEVLK